MSGNGLMPREFTGVKRPNFDELERQHRQAASRLHECAYALWVELSQAGLDTSPAIRIRELAERASSQAKDLGRRLQLVHEMQRCGFDFGFSGPSCTWFSMPDDVGDLQARLAGGKAADLAMRIAAKGDPADFAKFKALAQGRNPEFARTLMQRLGAAGMIDVVGRLGLRVDSASTSGDPTLAGCAASESRLVLQTLSQALAQTTDSKSRAYLGRGFLEEVKKQGGAQHTLPTKKPYSGYWALGQVLHSADPWTPYSEGFAKTVGRDMIRWDRESRKQFGWPESLNPYGSGSPGANPAAVNQLGRDAALDPLNGLMKAASNNKEAAQSLFYDGQENPPETLKYLISQRAHQWGITDQGDALGLALEKAAKGNDPLSKILAVQFTQVRADDIKSFAGPKGNQWTITNESRVDNLSGLRDSTSVILGNHLGDISNALNHPADRLPPGSETDNRGSAIFVAVDVNRLFADIGRDSNAYRSLLWTQAAHMRYAINDAYNTPGKLVTDAAAREAKVLGHIVDGYRHANMAKELPKDKAQEKAEKSLTSLLEFGAGVLPIPGAKLAGKAAGETPKLIYEGFTRKQFGELGKKAVETEKGIHQNKAYISSSREGKAASKLIGRILDTAIIERGLDLEHIRQKEEAYQKDNPGKRLYSFTTGQEEGLQIRPPAEWDAIAWREFYEYSETEDDPRIPAGRDETNSLGEIRENSENSYRNGMTGSQENLDLDANATAAGEKKPQ